MVKYIMKVDEKLHSGVKPLQTQFNNRYTLTQTVCLVVAMGQQSSMVHIIVSTHLKTQDKVFIDVYYYYSRNFTVSHNIYILRIYSIIYVTPYK